MFIQRDFERTEHDDFILNIKLLDYEEVVPIYHPTEGYILGWNIKRR